jgi:hypothetical protein
MEQIKLALIQLAWILSVPLVAASVLWMANELYYRSFGRYKVKAILTTGVIGTPVHELAHAVTATLFGMKVIKVAFFRPDPASKTLGYVDYQYSPTNFVHRLGMAFTGLAPLFVGSYIAYMMFSLSGLPNLHSYFVLDDPRALATLHAFSSVSAWAQSLLWELRDWQNLLVVMVAVMIGAHSTPSAADLKGTVRGMSAILIVLAAYWGLLQLLPSLPELLMDKSVKMLNHLSTAILQLALLSSLFALTLSLLGIVLRVASSKPVTAECVASVQTAENYDKPLELSKLG